MRKDKQVWHYHCAFVKKENMFFHSTNSSVHSLLLLFQFQPLILKMHFRKITRRQYIVKKSTTEYLRADYSCCGCLKCCVSTVDIQCEWSEAYEGNTVAREQWTDRYSSVKLTVIERANITWFDSRQGQGFSLHRQIQISSGVLTSHLISTEDSSPIRRNWQEC